MVSAREGLRKQPRLIRALCDGRSVMLQLGAAAEPGVTLHDSRKSVAPLAQPCAACAVVSPSPLARPPPQHWAFCGDLPALRVEVAALGFSITGYKPGIRVDRRIASGEGLRHLTQFVCAIPYQSSFPAA